MRSELPKCTVAEQDWLKNSMYLMRNHMMDLRVILLSKLVTELSLVSALWFQRQYWANIFWCCTHSLILKVFSDVHNASFCPQENSCSGRKEGVAHFARNVGMLSIIFQVAFFKIFILGTICIHLCCCLIFCRKHCSGTRARHLKCLS